ncbi:MAG: DUF5011 domain-containing protein [Lachnospiraceae bacterium]|nr:DUF5011 domain-containing protein [Lachnospiraceae bacterium]
MVMIMKKLLVPVLVATIGLCALTACSQRREGANTIYQTGKVPVAGQVQSSSDEKQEDEQSTENTTTKPEIITSDVTPPVISGAEDITVEEGKSISYKKNVTVTDDMDEAVELVIDNSEVDLSTPGEYKVYYTATDSAGNKTEVVINVVVTKETGIDENEVYALADKVIAEVTNENMTLWQKTYKLWNWCRTHILYSTSAGDRTSEITGAYEGLKLRKGDCYAYYATYAVLLDRIGVENMKVARINGKTNHWWNLVNIGDGWYHCDSSPRTLGDPYMCFMQTDAQLAAYTEAYTLLHPEKPNYFTFDPTAYPDRETVIVYSGYPN